MMKKNNHNQSRPSDNGRSLAAGIICLGFSILGFWIAFSGEDIRGGIPFMAETANQGVGRILFGGGAVITGWMSVMAFREFFGK